MFKPVILTAAVAVVAIGLASCSRFGIGNTAPAPNPPPAPAPAPSSVVATSGAPAASPITSPGPSAYEVVVIPGSPSVNAGYFRVTVASGQVVDGWGSATQLAAIPDTPIPAGRYHLYGYSQPAAADGSVNWGLIRVDLNSGRMWVVTGGGNVPLTWQEMAQPH